MQGGKTSLPRRCRAWGRARARPGLGGARGSLYRVPEPIMDVDDGPGPDRPVTVSVNQRNSASKRNPRPQAAALPGLHHADKPRQRYQSFARPAPALHGPPLPHSHIFALKSLCSCGARVMRASREAIESAERYSRRRHAVTARAPGVSTDFSRAALHRRSKLGLVAQF